MHDYINAGLLFNMSPTITYLIAHNYTFVYISKGKIFIYFFCGGVGGGWGEGAGELKEGGGWQHG